MAKGAKWLGPRKHKRMTFYPVYDLPVHNKRDLKNYLVQPRSIQLSDGRIVNGRLADHYFFRIWKHKHHGWTLYLNQSFEKQSHGGLRVKGSGKSNKTPYLGSKNKSKEPNPLKFDFDAKNISEIQKEWKRIETGPHSGKFKHKQTGDIMDETQLRILQARRGRSYD